MICQIGEKNLPRIFWMKMFQLTRTHPQILVGLNLRHLHQEPTSRVPCRNTLGGAMPRAEFFGYLKNTREGASNGEGGAAGKAEGVEQRVEGSKGASSDLRGVNRVRRGGFARPSWRRKGAPSSKPPSSPPFFPLPHPPPPPLKPGPALFKPRRTRLRPMLTSAIFSRSANFEFGESSQFEFGQFRSTSANFGVMFHHVGQEHPRNT